MSNSWPNSFYRQRINPQIFAGFFFATSFQPFWRGIARLQVFLWPFGKTAHHFFANITVKPPPPPKRSVGNSTRAPLVCCGNSAMAPRLAFKVKHVLSQKWHYTLSSTYKHSTDLGCKKGTPPLFFTSHPVTSYLFWEDQTVQIWGNFGRFLLLYPCLGWYSGQTITTELATLVVLKLSEHFS